VVVTDDFRHVCEMRRRSMAAQMRVLSEAYVAREDIRKAVGAWEEAALTDALTPEVPSCGLCKGTGLLSGSRCHVCHGTGKRA